MAEQGVDILALALDACARGPRQRVRVDRDAVLVDIRLHYRVGADQVRGIVRVRRARRAPGVAADPESESRRAGDVHRFVERHRHLDGVSRVIRWRRFPHRS